MNLSRVRLTSEKSNREKILNSEGPDIFYGYLRPTGYRRVISLNISIRDRVDKVYTFIFRYDTQK